MGGNAIAGAAQSVMARSTAYTPPRMITLDTKFDGAIRIDVWTGFAIQVVNSNGERRTIVGPHTVLLQYDEYLERLSLSKGKPKSSDTVIKTPYLRYTSNSVSDIISLKTQDLTAVDVHVKYRIRFEAAHSDKWFAVDNYVQYMVDHLRSRIGNHIRNINVQEFYIDATNILRDLVLGKKDQETGHRALTEFSENGMTVYDLELLGVTVQDRNVADLLARSRQETLGEMIALQRAVEKTKFVKGMEKETRDQLTEVAETTELRDKQKAELEKREDEAKLADVQSTNLRTAEASKGTIAAAQAKEAAEKFMLAIEKARRDLDDAYATAATDRSIRTEKELAEAHKVRMEAVAPALVEAMVGMAQTGQLSAIAEHLAPLAIVRGESISGTFEQLLKGTGGRLAAQHPGSFQGWFEAAETRRLTRESAAGFPPPPISLAVV